MIIEALCRYYDILVKDANVEIARLNCSPANVSFVVVLSKSGELIDIVDIRNDEKPITMIVPYRKKRSREINPYFMCEKASYVFGVDGDEITSKSTTHFNAFKQLHNELLKNANCDSAKAFLVFINNWQPSDFATNKFTQKYSKELVMSNIAFKCETNEYMHENDEISNIWQQKQNNKNTEGKTQCLVSGKASQIANTHQNIKGIYNAHKNGAALVSFNAPAFCSYGFKQGENAPMSTEVEFKYTTVLNYLTTTNAHKIRIGDTTIVFWAEINEQKKAETLIQNLFSPFESKDADAKELQQNIKKRNELKDILTCVKNGKHIDENVIDINPDTKFYMLGLSPVIARLAIKSWHVDSVCDYIEKVAQHHLDMEIAYKYETKLSSVYDILDVAKKHTSEKKDDVVLFADELSDAIFTNTQYPIGLCNNIINRLCIDMSADNKSGYNFRYAQIGFLKAYLLRYNRMNGLSEDLIKVDLNEENTSAPYCMGRLLSVMNTLQYVAMGNNVVESKYYNSASKTPAFIFPDLISRYLINKNKLLNTKTGYAINASKQVEALISAINKFPTQLTLEQQCEFAVGYHQQNIATQKLFAENKEKNNKENKKTEEFNEEKV
jgi:CRISPR-associated protein Csd1